MAMNFKIFADNEAVEQYSADLIRKQVHNNPESVLVLESAESLNGVYETVTHEVKKHPASFTQINLVMANNRGSLEALESLNIPKDHFFKSGKQDNLEKIFESIEKKRKRIIDLSVLEMKADENFGFENGENDEIYKGKEIVVIAIGPDKAQLIEKLYQAADNAENNYAKLKDHRMVTIVMDVSAAEELDPDIAEYYRYKYA